MNPRCFLSNFCPSSIPVHKYPYWGKYGKALVHFLRPRYGVVIQNGSLVICENILNESDFEVLENVVSVELTQEILTKTIVKHSSK